MGLPAAVVLAAGQSTRMGALKPALMLGGMTVLERTVRSFREVGIEDVHVVAGHRADEVASMAAHAGASCVVNAEWRQGMFSSVKVGIGALDPAVREVLLLPADCCLVRGETIGRLARAASGRGPVAYPVFAGRRGHPPLICVDELLPDMGPEPPYGLRSLLLRYDARALEVEVADEGVLLDIDTPEDFARACDYAWDEAIPTQDRCLAVLREHAVSEGVVGHSQMVARVAGGLAARLTTAGLCLNVDLVVAAAMLHDIARDSSDHAAMGAYLITRLGYRRVAPVVEHHMDLVAEPGCLVDEAELLFLADKLVEDDHIVDLDTRLATRLNRFASQPAAEGAVRERMKTAQELSRRVGRLLGESTEALAARIVSGDSER